MTRRSPAFAISQRVMRRGARMILDRRASLTITGNEHIPADGPCVIVARHYHNLFDGCALYQATSRPLHILVGLDWAGGGVTRRGMELLCRMAEWPTVLRSDALERERATPERRAEARRLMREATRQSVDLLAGGEALVMFPEGYPVVDPHAKAPRANLEGLLPFQPGVVRLLAMAEKRIGHDIPVVPVGFAYGQAPDGVWTIDMGVGAPLTRDEDAADDAFLHRLEDAVRDLSGIRESR